LDHLEFQDVENPGVMVLLDLRVPQVILDDLDYKENEVLWVYLEFQVLEVLKGLKVNEVNKEKEDLKVLE
jgi:hypothetical protein